MTATVIARLMDEVTAQLGEQSAAGAAKAVWMSAATFEPKGQASNLQDEHLRLLLLCDRAVRRWTPQATIPLREAGLQEQLERAPRIEFEAQAVEAGRHIDQTLEWISGHDWSHLPPRRVEQVRAACTAIGNFVAAVAHGDPANPHDTARTAVPLGAQALLATWRLGSFGVPEEMRECVTALDNLDPERTVPKGFNAPRRTYEQAEQEEDYTQTQLAALLSFEAGPGEHLALYLAVPVGHGKAAVAAAKKACPPYREDQLTVHEFELNR